MRIDIAESKTSNEGAFCKVSSVIKSAKCYSLYIDLDIPRNGLNQCVTEGTKRLFKSSAVINVNVQGRECKSYTVYNIHVQESERANF